MAARHSLGHRAGAVVARGLFPPGAPRSRPFRRAVLRRTLRAFADALDGTPMAGRFWLTGGLAIGYARRGEALEDDLFDVDLGYADRDHERMMASIDALAAARFFPSFYPRSNSGEVTVVRLQRDGVGFDLLRCFERGDREYWICYLTDRVSGLVPCTAEVEIEVRLQPKVPIDPPLYGTTWLAATDLRSYLTEQYPACMAPDEEFYSPEFYARGWDTIRDSPAVVRCEPWQSSWRASAA